MNFWNCFVFYYLFILPFQHLAILWLFDSLFLRMTHHPNTSICLFIIFILALTQVEIVFPQWDDHVMSRDTGTHNASQAMSGDTAQDKQGWVRRFFMRVKKCMDSTHLLFISQFMFHYQSIQKFCYFLNHQHHKSDRKMFRFSIETLYNINHSNL